MLKQCVLIFSTPTNATLKQLWNLSVGMKVAKFPFRNRTGTAWTIDTSQLLPLQKRDVFMNPIRGLCFKSRIHKAVEH